MKTEQFLLWLDTAMKAFPLPPYLQLATRMSLHTMTEMIELRGDPESETVESIQGLILGRLARMTPVYQGMDTNPYTEALKDWIEGEDKKDLETKLMAHAEITLDFLDMMFFNLKPSKSRKVKALALAGEIDQIIHARDDVDSLALVMKLAGISTEPLHERVISLDRAAIQMKQYMKKRADDRAVEFRAELAWMYPDAWWSLAMNMEQAKEEILRLVKEIGPSELIRKFKR